MPAKMQLLIRCNRRIFLAICLILFVGYTAQGKMGRLFSVILFLGYAVEAKMKRYQDLGDIFPLSEEDSGSGSNTVVEAEPASGSGLGDNDSFSEAKLPVFLESLRGSELKEKLSEEDLFL